MPAESDGKRIKTPMPPGDKAARVPGTGPQQLLQDMQQRGELTEYQDEQLRSGQGQNLVVGPFVLLAPLGRGGMGEVFRARHHLLDREAALKVIRADYRANRVAVTRFLREAKAVAALKHPNIVSVYDSGDDGDLLFLAMELLPGMDLARYLEQQGPLPLAEACDLIRQAALGLQHAHEQGLVHRDVKPPNLMRSPSGQVQVLDLGLALLATSPTLTQPTGLMGTVDYIAPEQITDPHNVDIRADVYSLGCSLYHLLVGRTPYVDALPAVRAACHLAVDPPPVEKLRPELPRSFVAVLRRMMARKRENRYQTPGEVAEALEAFTKIDRPPQKGDAVAGWLLEERLDADAALFRGVKGSQSAAVLLLPPSVKQLPPALQTLAELRHPSLMEVQECGTTGLQGSFYAILTMDSGLALEEYLLRRGPLGLKKARPLFLKLAEALALAHARNIVHGSIHSASILLRRDGSPVLVDFDLTGATAPRRLLGKPTNYPLLFAPPEQVHKGRTDERSDVYSLAAVLYYALGYNDAERREPAMFDPEIVPEELRELLKKSLDRKPERRPANAGAFRDALRATGEPVQVDVPLPGIWYSRPQNAPQSEWVKVAQTPATVSIQNGEVYRLVATAVKDEQIKLLAEIHGLTALLQLDLALCSELTDAGLVHLQRLPGLQELWLVGCRQLTEQGIKALRAARPNLQIGQW